VDNVEIFEKRGRWCLRDGKGTLHKFPTELEAKEFLGFKDPVKDCIDEDCDGNPCECDTETEDGKKEEESGKEKASPNKQKTVLSSKGSSKKKI
jgi:hypothetical protein|tara:strand:- start:160 stop:441 length:282 start_codon:yes stop_codon:yes gene_type:complete